MGSLAGRSVIVVGGGVGGLSSACYLAEAGAEVRVVERNEQLGGRASRLRADGFTFDMGPSWYLMPDVFERFFEHFDRSPGDYYELQRLDPHYRVFFKDGDSVDVTGDVDEMAEVFESYETGAGNALRRYLRRSSRNYEVAMEHFVYEDRSRLRDFLDLSVARHARGLSLLGSMQGHVESYFEHPKLQQLVQYSLVFLGGSPRNTPALYNLMSHVDFNLGVWYPDGGIGSVVDGLVELGRELGVEYETGQEVTSISRRNGSMAVDWTTAGRSPPFPDGGDSVQSHRSDVVVSNADYAHTELELLDPADRTYDASYWNNRTYAPSAFLCYLGIEGSVPALAHHTLVLPTDWEEHFQEIFEDPQWPENPAYYCCVPSKTDPTVAPTGHTALFLLVPIAPGLEDGPDRRRWYRDRILDDLATHTNSDLRDRIVSEEIFCVSDFAERYNSYRGSALGLAHTLRQTALFRPNRRSTTLEGLYYTGSYTNPGIGVPMCLISGEHTADAVRADLPGSDEDDFEDESTASGGDPTNAGRREPPVNAEGTQDRT